MDLLSGIDFQTMCWILGAIGVIIAGFFIGLWMFGIAIVCSLIFGAYAYFKFAEDKAMMRSNDTELSAKEELEDLKKRALKSTEELGEALAKERE